MTNPDQPLKPADFSPRPSAPSADARKASKPRWLAPGFAVLAVLAVGVFFVLPVLVTSPTTSNTVIDSSAPGAPIRKQPTTDDSRSDTETSTMASAERSPFAEAQSQQQRREAQEALQKVLELQEILVSLSVLAWAPDDYAAAIATAESGDNAYRSRRFEEASMAYRNAGEQLLAIERSVPGRTSDAIAELTAAIETGDERGAKAVFTLLQQLAANDPQLGPLQQRLAAVAQVSNALESAATAAAQRNFEQALSDAERALKADPDSQRAASARAQYQTSLQAQRYRQAMSSGYLAMEEGNFEAAEAAFNRATSLGTGSPEPQAALAELASARTDAQLRKLRQSGAEREQAEDWQGAETAYQEALAIDNSLVFAQQGLVRARPRKQLHERLRKTLEETERLVDDTALAGGQALLNEARAIGTPGPVLAEQIAMLDRALRYAQTPVDIVLVSDDLTDVTLLRVKRLGHFPETRLSLRPGRYTALGIRNGYRDIRVEFEVKPGELQRIDVRCDESIEASL